MSCSILEHPSWPFLDQTLGEHSGGLVGRATNRLLGVIRNGLWGWYPPCTHKWLGIHCSHGCGGEEERSSFSCLPLSTYHECFEVNNELCHGWEKHYLRASKLMADSQLKRENHWLFRMAHLNCLLIHHSQRHLNFAIKCSDEKCFWSKNFKLFVKTLS